MLKAREILRLRYQAGLSLREICFLKKFELPDRCTDKSQHPKEILKQKQTSER